MQYRYIPIIGTGGIWKGSLIIQIVSVLIILHRLVSTLNTPTPSIVYFTNPLVHHINPMMHFNNTNNS